MPKIEVINSPNLQEVTVPCDCASNETAWRHKPDCGQCHGSGKWKRLQYKWASGEWRYDIPPSLEEFPPELASQILAKQGKPASQDEAPTGAKRPEVPKDIDHLDGRRYNLRFSALDFAIKAAAFTKPTCGEDILLAAEEIERWLVMPIKAKPKVEPQT